MGEVFIKLLNMSITASWLILAVLCVRRLFRKIPKWITCFLWGVVAIRLIFPFSIESEFSLQPSAEPIKASAIVEGEVVPYVPSLDSNLDIVTNTVNPILAESFAYQEWESVAPLQIVTGIAGNVWFCGMIVLFLFAVVSVFRLRLRVREAVPYQENIYLCDGVSSPFILGVIKPRIYLFSGISEEEAEYIVAHEKAHLRRKDYLWKPLGYLLLCVYWFNPLCWIAYMMLCKDIELACDEKVIKDMSFGDKKEYSRVLLSCATQRRLVLSCPLAFGEVGVKERVKSILNYKKPAFWITMIAIIVCMMVAVCFLTNPVEKRAESSNSSDGAESSVNEEPEQEATLIDSEQSEEHSGLQDLTYYLELSVSDLEFQPMSETRKTEILQEYENLLEDYTLMARESTDGKTSYIAGHYNGDVTKSPLYKMQDMGYSSDKHYQILYLEENREAMEWVKDEQGVQAITDEAYVIEESWMYRTTDAEYIFIQPNGAEQELYSTFSTYFNPARGRQYIEDALSRGIALNEPEEPYLSIFMISERYGEITERIPLSEEEAADILAEDKRTHPKGYGFGATLKVNGESIYYSEESVPMSVLDLAVEKCGYQFASPESITAPITEACLDCSWLEEPLYLEEAYLSQLEEILKSAKYIGVGNCGYGAKLTLTLENGETVTVFKGTDDCGSLVFGSWGGYSINDEADDEFWEMFGLSPDVGTTRVDTSAISGIVVINGNTGERKNLTTEDYEQYYDLLKLYNQLDFSVECEENSRVGYQYCMMLQPTDEDADDLIMVTPYKDGVVVDGIFYLYENTGNGAEASLRLMEYMEEIFYPNNVT